MKVNAKLCKFIIIKIKITVAEWETYTVYDSVYVGSTELRMRTRTHKHTRASWTQYTTEACKFHERKFAAENLI